MCYNIFHYFTESATMENSETHTQKRGTRTYWTLPTLTRIKKSFCRRRAVDLLQQEKQNICQNNPPAVELKTFKVTREDSVNYSRDSTIKSSSKMCSLASHLVKEKLRILVTPKDGLCLLHSVAMACRHLNPKIELRIKDFKELIREESIKRIKDYINFMASSSEEAFNLAIDQFLDNGVYDSDVGDAVPYMIANALAIKINIFNCNSHNVISIEPNAEECLENIPELSLVLRDQHYDALVPLSHTNLVTSLKSSEIEISNGITSLESSEISNPTCFSEPAEELSFVSDHFSIVSIGDVDANTCGISDVMTDSSSGYSTYCGTDEEMQNPVESKIVEFVCQQDANCKNSSSSYSNQLLSEQELRQLSVEYHPEVEIPNACYFTSLSHSTDSTIATISSSTPTLLEDDSNRDFTRLNSKKFTAEEVRNIEDQNLEKNATTINRAENWRPSNLNNGEKLTLVFELFM